MDLAAASLQMRLQKEDSDGGLEPYRSVHGEEQPASSSLLLSCASLQRYLQQHCWDVDAAADAVKCTLSWRRRVLPTAAESHLASTGRAAALLEERHRVRRIGRNRDGDHVPGCIFLILS